MRIISIDLIWPDNALFFECEYDGELFTLSRHDRKYDLLDEFGELVQNDLVKCALINYCAHLSTQAIQKGLGH